MKGPCTIATNDFPSLSEEPLQREVDQLVARRQYAQALLLLVQTPYVAGQGVEPREQVAAALQVERASHEREWAAPFEYGEFDWGDSITGTKAQLQALGLGDGMAFPGEEGGPKRSMTVIDPRGFAAKIERPWGGNKQLYVARIPFPGRTMPSLTLTRGDFAPGVVVDRIGYTCDEYRGSAEALAAAGLVRPEQMPGQPAMRKVRVTVLPDGTTPDGPPTANHRAASLPGAKVIERASLGSGKSLGLATLEIVDDLLHHL